jgi:hypothetical protein
VSPYLQAWETWHADGPPPVAWDELLTFFLHHGVVISTAEGFLLARRCRVDQTDAELDALSPLQFRGAADCWNVWLAAGRLPFLLHLASRHPLPWVAFCRDGGRLRRYRTAAILRHDQAESPSPATASPAACHVHGA